MCCPINIALPIVSVMLLSVRGSRSFRRHVNAAMGVLAVGLLVFSSAACSRQTRSGHERWYTEADTLPPQWSSAESTVDGAAYTMLARVRHGYSAILLDVELNARDPHTGDPVHFSAPSASMPEVRLLRALEDAGSAPWSSRRLDSSGCRYRTVERAPTRPVLPLGRADTVPAEVLVDSSSVDCRFDVPAMLGDSLSPGLYHVVTRVHTGRSVAELEGRAVFLTGDTLPPVGSAEALRAQLRYEARSWVEDSVPGPYPGVGPWLETVVRVTNAGNRRVGLSYGDQPLGLRIYQTEERSGEPVWSRGPGGGIAIQKLRFISPGETIGAPDFHLRLLVGEILGDSLPSGIYHFSVVVELDGRQMIPTPESIRDEFSAVTAAVLAGKAYLSIPGRRSP